MTWGEAILLGLLQGFTEFLPVSSSGHLVIFQHVFRISQPGVTFEVLVHFGTMFSVILVFWKDITALFKGLTNNSEQKKLFLLLLVGTIATGCVGIIFGSSIKGLFQNPVVTGIMLLLTGFITLAISRVSISPAKNNFSRLTLWDGVFVGLMQGFAIIPGISRSGTTILASLFRGMSRQTAIKFSFLLALPAIAGATALEAWDFIRAGAGETPLFSSGYILAAFLAFLSGVFSIKIFIKLLNKGKFYYFSYYCWFAGVFTILYFTFLSH